MFSRPRDEIALKVEAVFVQKVRVYKSRKVLALR